MNRGAPSRWRIALAYHVPKARLSGCTPPYALMILGTALRDGGIDVRIFDVDAYDGDRSRMVRDIAAWGPSLVGLPLFFNGYRETAATLGRLSEACGPVPVVLGGAEVSTDIDNVRRNFPAVPYLLAGEAEHSLLLLCEALRDGGSVSEIPGLARMEGGTWSRVTSAPR